MGSLKKPLSLKGFNHSSFEPIHRLAKCSLCSRKLAVGVFSWYKKHPSTWLSYLKWLSTWFLNFTAKPESILLSVGWIEKYSMNITCQAKKIYPGMENLNKYFRLK